MNVLQFFGIKLFLTSWMYFFSVHYYVNSICTSNWNWNLAYLFLLILVKVSFLDHTCTIHLKNTVKCCFVCGCVGIHCLCNFWIMYTLPIHGFCDLKATWRPQGFWESKLLFSIFYKILLEFCHLHLQWHQWKLPSWYLEANINWKAMIS